MCNVCAIAAAARAFTRYRPMSVEEEEEWQKAPEDLAHNNETDCIFGP